MSPKLAVILRMLLGGVLIWAAVAKLAAPAAFFSELSDYQVPLPAVVWQLVAVSLPWFELLCGAALIANIWAETVRPMVTGLCACFVAMLLQAVIRGLDLSCGCFGRSNAWFERPGLALARAVVLLGISWAITAAKPHPAAGSSSTRRPEL